MKPSAQQMDNIYCCWQRSIPPTEVSRVLRLAYMTVLREYVRLDEVARTNK
jgi:hypothetical protein